MSDHQTLLYIKYMCPLQGKLTTYSQILCCKASVRHRKSWFCDFDLYNMPYKMYLVITSFKKKSLRIKKEEHGFQTVVAYYIDKATPCKGGLAVCNFFLTKSKNLLYSRNELVRHLNKFLLKMSLVKQMDWFLFWKIVIILIKFTKERQLVILCFHAILLKFLDNRYLINVKPLIGTNCFHSH